MNRFRKFRNKNFHGEISIPDLSATDEYNGRRRIYVLNEPFMFCLWFPGGKFEITVPSGYKTDLATLPIWTQIILGNRDSYAEESILHDHFCTSDMPRFFANSTMRSVMQLLHRPKWKRVAIFWGLTLFGYKSLTMSLFEKVRRTLYG